MPSSTPFPNGPEQSAERVVRDAGAVLKRDLALQKAIKSKIMQRVSHPALFQEVRTALTPQKVVKDVIWARVKNSLQGASSSISWAKIREFLQPALEEQSTLWRRVMARIELPQLTPSYAPAFRFATAFVLVVIATRIGSGLFFASPTIAKTEVQLIPHGSASVLIGGLFQPVTDTIVLEKPALIQTGIDGTATIVFHDIAVLRLGPNTTIALHDVSDSPSQKYSPTMTAYRGKVWVQGFLGSHSQPLTVGTEQGTVQIREGSVAIIQGGDEEGAETDITVWNRRATIVHEGEIVSLFAGDRTALTQNKPVFVSKLPRSTTDAWTKDNLALDIVHQREIAKLQQDRLASQAGVLPTNHTLYPLKRLAEQVDVLLTVGSEAKAKVLLDQAQTRLSEAAALLQEGSVSDAQTSLQEYKQAMQYVSSGSGDTIVRSLVSQRVAEVSASLSAALPEDGLYPVKEAVLQATTVIPEENAIDTQDAQRQLLTDRLASLVRKVGVGESTDVAALRLEQQDLHTAIDAFRKATSGEPADFFKEASSTMIRLDSEITAIEGRLTQSESGTLVTAPGANLTEAQVVGYADRIVRRILLYSEERSQVNQLHLEILALRTNSAEGRILRKLKQALPGAELQHFIDLEFIYLRATASSSSEHGAAPEDPLVEAQQ